MKTWVMMAAAAVALSQAASAAADPPRSGAPGLSSKPQGMPPGQAKKYNRGERLPLAYVTERRYIVVEPAVYRLRPAPAGYRWVVIDGDAYLVATTTGLIADVVRALL